MTAAPAGQSLPAQSPAVDRGRRMRMIATGLLVLMAAVFFVSRRLEHIHPAVGFITAFAEAAMVGAMADWFAVTALFRHPLGLPIPHTAIIPTNKDRIADTMAQFLRDNFLTPQVVARRMRSMNFAAAAGAFLADPQGGDNDNARRLRSGAAGLLGDVLQSLDDERLGRLAKGTLRSQLEKIDAAPLLGQMLAGMIADRRHMPLIDAAIRWAALTLEVNEPLIRTMITQRANALVRFTGLDNRIANAILDGLYKLLAETVVDPDHPLRRRIEDGLEQLADDLVNDPAMRRRIARMKDELIANPAVGAWLDSVWERARAGLLRMLRDPESVLGGQLGEAFSELGTALHSNARLQWLVNRFARRTAVGIANRHGDQLVRLVSETVRRWDATTITDRVEKAVGRDLQFIRINGTLVGGLVGVCIHTLKLWI